MRTIVLVGVPDSGKSKVFESLLKAGSSHKFFYLNDINYSFLADTPSRLLDYRQELALATSRAVSDLQRSLGPQVLKTNVIVSHSLLDSFAYATVRYKHMAESGSVSEEQLYAWWLTLNSIACMFKDSFKADKIYRLIGAAWELDETENYFNEQLEEAYTAILDNFGMQVDEVFVTSPLQDTSTYDKIANRLIKDIDSEQGLDSTDSNEQES